MKFRPLNDRVLLQRVDEDTKTASGIIIPDTAQEKPSQGVIKAVGPGARNEAGERVPMSVAAGDKVMFGKWSGTEVNLEGTDYLIMGESDIMAVIEDAAPAKKSKSKKKAA